MTLVISVEDGNTGKINDCKSCAYSYFTKELSDCDFKRLSHHDAVERYKRSYNGCKGQFKNTHKEGDEVEQFYKRISGGCCVRMKDPTFAELDEQMKSYVQERDIFLG